MYGNIGSFQGHQAPPEKRCFKILQWVCGRPIPPLHRWVNLPKYPTNCFHLQNIGGNSFASMPDEASLMNAYRVVKSEKWKMFQCQLWLRLTVLQALSAEACWEFLSIDSYSPGRVRRQEQPFRTAIKSPSVTSCHFPERIRNQVPQRGPSLSSRKPCQMIVFMRTRDTLRNTTLFSIIREESFPDNWLPWSIRAVLV